MVAKYFPEQRLQLARARGIIVDEEDTWLLVAYAWYVTSHGYAKTTMYHEGMQTPTYLHHCIIGQPIWEEDQIDHINQDRLDNRRNNLRYATRSENLLNNNQPYGASGARGITPLPNGKYMVRTNRNGVQHYLGTFDTLDEAVAERDEWLANNMENKHGA